MSAACRRSSSRKRPATSSNCTVPAGRNAKHAAQWEATLRDYAFPHIGHVAVADVTTADVLRILTAIWHDKPETARRVRQRISAVMKWAVAQGPS